MIEPNTLMTFRIRNHTAIKRLLPVQIGRDEAVPDASRQITASMLPAALVVWPVNAFVEETGGILSPKRRIIARLSLASLFGVAVPWAFT